MNEDILKKLRFIEACEKLKTTMRAASHLSDGTRESVAEHSWRLALLCECFLPDFPEVNAERAIKMALMHDLAEMITGDVSAKYQTDKDAKHLEETEVMRSLTAILPDDLSEEFFSIFTEYNECKTPTSLFVKAMDKTETILEQNQAINLDDFDYEFNLGYGAGFFKNNEILKGIRSYLDEGTKVRMRETE